MASPRVAHRQSGSVLSLTVDAAQVDQAEIWDMIVVGGGPAGLGAALIGAQSKLKVLLVDKEKSLGGQLVANVEIPILDMPGFSSITGKELARKLADQIKRLPITICKNAKVTKLIKQANGIAVHLNNGKILQGKTVFIGTGITPRKLNVPGEEFLPLGRPHDAQDRHGTKVVVVGGGDEACSAAMHLANDGAHVIMVVRNSVMRARTHFAEPVFEHPNIEVVKPEKVVGIEKVPKGFGFNLASDGKINVDGGFIRIGVEPNFPAIEPTPKLHPDGRLMVDSHGQTTTAGIYGGGDVTRVPSEQYVVAANSDGILTARKISNQLAP